MLLRLIPKRLGKIDTECDKMKSEPLDKEKNKVMIWKQSLKLIIHWFLTM